MTRTRPAPRHSDQTKRARLRKARLLAFALLAAAGLLYVLARAFRPGHPWLGFVAAFGEAAMVGALADWFAVAALFRRPLGLPLPHTAIISANKGRIADSLGQFVQSRFLSTSKVLEAIRAFGPGRRIAKWCLREENAERIEVYLRHAARRLVEAVDGEPARALLASALASGLKAQDAGMLAARVLRVFAEDRRHQWLLDEALAQLYEFLQHDDVRQELVYAIARHMEFVPSTLNLDERVGRAILQRLYDALQTVLQAVRADHDHVLRRRFDEAVADIGDRLVNDPVFRARIQATYAELLRERDLEPALSALWDGLRHWLLGQLADRRGPLARRLGTTVRALAASLASRPQLHAWVDAQIASYAPPLIARYRRSLGLFIAAQVKTWDDTFLVDQIELAIGRDLQFIRINGTLVGGFVGLAIYTATRLIG